MSPTKLNHLLKHTISELSESCSLHGLFHEHHDGDPLPSGPILSEIVDLCRAIIFPGFYGQSTVSSQTLPYYIGVNIDRLYNLLSEQIWAGLCFSRKETANQENTVQRAQTLAAAFVERLPELRKILATDVEATFTGDPAAESYGEIISCYPVIKAISNYRIAHELLLLDFTIDHGTGVVIGATCIIGNNVKLYQGVTLGAKSFPLDENGHPIKGIPRHPILEDNVIVYSNATILGRITISKGTVIGGNIWVTQGTKPGEQLIQSKTRKGNIKNTIIRPEDFGGL